jgi:hypothetical protein
MLFSRKSPPSGYYHYLYLRKDGTPYYSGKGKDGRAWAKEHTIKPPTDQSRIVITHWDLTEVWALAMERWYIRWYGRKDNGTGILRNKTDGGDGTSGHIKSDDTIEQMRKSMTGKNTGPQTESHKQNAANARRGIKQTEEHIQSRVKAHLGKTRSAETKKRISDSKIGKKTGPQPKEIIEKKKKAWTEELRQEQSVRLKSKWTEERKKERSAAMTGKKRGPLS